MSSIFVLQFPVDLQVGFDQGHTTIEDVGGFEGTESLKATMPYAVELSQVPIHRIQTVIGFASDLVGTFALGLSFMTDNPFVG